MLTVARDHVRAHPAGVHLLLSVLVLAGALLSISACNTIEGAGQDMQAAGDAMSDTSEDVQD